MDARFLIDYDVGPPALELGDYLDKIRHPHKRAFLAACRRAANISEASRATGTPRSMHYVWMEHDVDYAIAYGLAQREAIERLEAVGWRRAEEGSDQLIKFFLQSVYPERYRQKAELRVVWDQAVEEALIRLIQVVEQEVEDPIVIERIRAGFARLAGSGVPA